MAAVRVEHVIRKLKQLVEAQRVTGLEELGHPRSLGRGSLRSPMTHGACPRVGKPCVGPRAHVLVAEITRQSELGGVYQMIEGYGLRNSRTSPDDHKDPDEGHEYGTPEQEEGAKALAAQDRNAAVGDQPTASLDASSGASPFESIQPPRVGGSSSGACLRPVHRTQAHGTYHAGSGDQPLVP